MKKVLKFGATWCAPCKLVQPILEKLEEQFPAIEFTHYDTDNDSETTAKYKVTALPTIIVMDGDEETHRFIGAQGGAELESALNE